MGISPDKAKLVALGSAFVYLVMLTIMIGMQCAFPCTWELKDLGDAGDAHLCGAFYAFSAYACTTDKIGFTVFVLLMLVFVVVTLVGMMYDAKWVMLFHAVTCLVGAVFITISLIIFIVKVCGLIAHWTFWRGILCHIFTSLAMILSAVMGYFAYKG